MTPIPSASKSTQSSTAVAFALLLLTTVLPAQALSPYHTWRDAAFGVESGNPAVADQLANPDDDGLPNFVEYVMSAHPWEADSPLVVDLDSGTPALNFRRSTLATDARITVQGTNDLSGPWTDLATSEYGAVFSPLIAGIQVIEDGGTTKSVRVIDSRSVEDPAKPGQFLRVVAAKKPTATVHAVLQGQSNAADMFMWSTSWLGETGFRSIFQPMVRDLTGIPNVKLYGDTTTSGQRTMVGGTYTYSSNTSLTTWLAFNAASDPSIWTLGPLGTECDSFLRAKIRGKVADDPVAFLRIHSEYDSRHTGDAVHYAAANRNFVTKMRDAAGLSARQMPVFYGQVPYSQGVTQTGMNAIRSAWRTDVADPSFNARYAWGSANDTDPMPASQDPSRAHVSVEGCKQAHSRMALAVARWLYDNGYSNTDLSSLPTVGPQIASFRRGPLPNQLDVFIQHESGTDLVIPEVPNLAVFTITDPGAVGGTPVVTGIDRASPTSLRLTLDKNLSASPAITLDHLRGNGLNGPSSLVTDNYHLLEKPAHVSAAITAYYPGLRMPLARRHAPLTIEP